MQLAYETYHGHIEECDLTLNKFPTPSSSPGAKTLLTYRNKPSPSLTPIFFRKKFKTTLNLEDALILNTFCLKIGAEPIG